MKILIYGEGYFFAIAPQLKSAFEQLNCDVDIFDWTSYLYTTKKINLRNRILNRILLPLIQNRINEHFINHIKSDAYDAILVITGWHLSVKSIETAKKHARCILNWSMEELFNNVFSAFINTETYNKYDIIFSPRQHLFKQYLSKGIKRIEYLPFFYYPQHYPIVPTGKDKELWGSDIAFMGTWSKEREKVLKMLEGHKVKIWGGGWNKSHNKFKHKFTITNKIAWLEDMSKVVNSTKIIVDTLTKEQNDKINMKNYQIPACGGFLLSQRTDEILALFEEDKEIVCYDSYEELKDKCEYYLLHGEDRKKIAINAHNKVVDGQNAIIDRAKQILDICCNSVEQ